MNRENLMSYLIAMWDIQDSLLQSYRNLFLTSQSIAFAIAVSIVSVSSHIWIFLALLLLFIGIFMVVYLWIPICKRRGYDVWFFHLNLLYLKEGKLVTVSNRNRVQIKSISGEDISGIFISFKNWQNMSIKDREFFMKHDKNGKVLMESKTRVKLEKHLPWTFIILWTVLGVFMIIKMLYGIE